MRIWGGLSRGWGRNPCRGAMLCVVPLLGMPTAPLSPQTPCIEHTRVTSFGTKPQRDGSPAWANLRTTTLVWWGFGNANEFSVILRIAISIGEPGLRIRFFFFQHLSRRRLDNIIQRSSTTFNVPRISNPIWNNGETAQSFAFKFFPQNFNTWSHVMEVGFRFLRY